MNERDVSTGDGISADSAVRVDELDPDVRLRIQHAFISGRCGVMNRDWFILSQRQNKAGERELELIAVQSAGDGSRREFWFDVTTGDTETPRAHTRERQQASNQSKTSPHRVADKYDELSLLRETFAGLSSSKPANGGELAKPGSGTTGAQKDRPADLPIEAKQVDPPKQGVPFLLREIPISSDLEDGVKTIAVFMIVVVVGGLLAWKSGTLDKAKKPTRTEITNSPTRPWTESSGPARIDDDRVRVVKGGLRLRSTSPPFEATTPSGWSWFEDHDENREIQRYVTFESSNSSVNFGIWVLPVEGVESEADAREFVEALLATSRGNGAQVNDVDVQPTSIPTPNSFRFSYRIEFDSIGAYQSGYISDHSGRTFVVMGSRQDETTRDFEAFVKSVHIGGATTSPNRHASATAASTPRPFVQLAGISLGKSKEEIRYNWGEPPNANGSIWIFNLTAYEGRTPHGTLADVEQQVSFGRSSKNSDQVVAVVISGELSPNKDGYNFARISVDRLDPRLLNLSDPFDVRPLTVPEIRHRFGHDTAWPIGPRMDTPSIGGIRLGDLQSDVSTRLGDTSWDYASGGRVRRAVYPERGAFVDVARRRRWECVVRLGIFDIDAWKAGSFKLPD